MLDIRLTYHRDPGALVTFLIGKESDPPKKNFVHKEFACHASPIFEAAFNSNFIEGQTQIYKLGDTTPRAFQLLTQWMYFQTCNISQLGNGTGRQGPDLSYPKQKTSEDLEEDKALFELWVLADKLRMPRLQNLALDMIFMVGNKTRIVTTYC
jgi:hypothetical protein